MSSGTCLTLRPRAGTDRRTMAWLAGTAMRGRERTDLLAPVVPDRVHPHDRPLVAICTEDATIETCNVLPTQAAWASDL